MRPWSTSAPQLAPLTVDYLGQTVQRRTPLDFLAMTDHAEYLGMVRLGRDPPGRHAGTRWPNMLAVTTFAQTFPLMRRLANPALTRSESTSDFHVSMACATIGARLAGLRVRDSRAPYPGSDASPAVRLV